MIMSDVVTIRVMQRNDIEKIVMAFQKPLDVENSFESYMIRCFKENETKQRVTWIAFLENEAVGYVHLLFQSPYPYFLKKNIPEINDLRVISEHRRKGIGKMLIDQCEDFASKHNDYIGLGVGLYKDYGSAQRLYTKNGYILDGQGMTYKNDEVKPGKNVFVDDDLLLYLYKKIG